MNINIQNEMNSYIKFINYSILIGNITNVNNTLYASDFRYTGDGAGATYIGDIENGENNRFVVDGDLVMSGSFLNKGELTINANSTLELTGTYGITSTYLPTAASIFINSGGEIYVPGLENFYNGVSAYHSSPIGPGTFMWFDGGPYWSRI
jgi:hypothetical protein